ncbi:MAG: coproporphyrinogen III oxidase [Rhodobacteraceae bacterium]|nr:coproporphyrinogen III oxidase [Paracoccaceae bacterium]
MTTEDWRDGGFGLYLHWPFCLAKCPYCDFNSHVVSQVDTDRWKRAYIAEIQRIGTETGPRTLNSVFFGGGTPSLMPPDLVGAILDTVRATWPCANDMETTLEANPTSVEAGRFAGYRDAGVTRVSLGVQALNDDDLRRLGRLHSVAEAKTAFDIARSTFDRVSFDLIYARQDQTLAAWQDELRTALAMAVDHLSLYQLTIEPGTAFGDQLARGGLRGLPDDDLGADMYFATQDLCAAAGLPAYEVSNHAKPGAESRHNRIYWRYGDYAGIGPGAHGRLTLGGTRWASDTPLSPATWLTRVEEQGSGENPRQPLCAGDQASEYLLMGLRLVEGISLSRYERISGSPINPFNIKDLVASNLLQQDGDTLRVTDQGRAVLNGVLRTLLAD